MLTQTLAIFHDAYRELNAKKMFWIVLGISGLVVIAFAGIGITTTGDVTIFGLRTPFDADGDPAEYYKALFLGFGVTFWLSIIASLLALVSTAAIFPDFISGGSIDLYLSKPISRLRLFLTKYASGLLFVALQVLVFALACFLVIGIRGGAWEPGIFLAVPLVVCFFSYLFGISVLIGVLTRSTLAALLLTLLAWFGLFLVDQSEVTLLLFKTAAEREVVTADRTLKVVNGQIASIDNLPLDVRAQRAEQLATLRTQRADLERQRAQNDSPSLARWHRAVIAAKSVLPKTRETTELLERSLLSNDQTDDIKDGGDTDGNSNGNRKREHPFKAQDVKQVKRVMKSRSIGWIVGTSLAFEAVVLALAAWVFCRRDY